MAGQKLLNIPIGKFNRRELASLKEDPLVWFASLASILLILAMSFFIFFSWNRLPPQVPLFYSRPWGEKQLSSPSGLWLLPTISFLVLTFNLFWAIFILNKEILLRRILAIAALIVSLLCLLTVYKIITLIT